MRDKVICVEMLGACELTFYGRTGIYEQVVRLDQSRDWRVLNIGLGHILCTMRIGGWAEIA